MRKYIFVLILGLILILYYYHKNFSINNFKQKENTKKVNKKKKKIMINKNKKNYYENSDSSDNNSSIIRNEESANSFRFTDSIGRPNNLDDGASFDFTLNSDLNGNNADNDSRFSNDEDSLLKML